MSGLVARAGEAAVSDLVVRLQEAAAAAIADVVPMAERDLPRIRSVHFELELANGGQVVECTAWIERKAKVRRDG